MDTLIFTNERYQNTFGQVSSPLEEIISTKLKKKKKKKRLLAQCLSLKTGMEVENSFIMIEKCIIEERFLVLGSTTHESCALEWVTSQFLNLSSSIYKMETLTSLGVSGTD